MKMTLADRLRKAMDEAGLTQASLAEKCGISQASIQKLVSGKAKSTTYIVEISEALSVNAKWLAQGEGLMRGAREAARLQGSDMAVSGFRVDLLDISVSAGPGSVNTNEFIEVVRTITYTPEEARMMFGNRSEEQIRMINVKGDSMSGTIEPGDLIFVDISVQSFDGDGIYAFLYDDTAHVKRLQKMKDYLLVLSDSPRYQTWDPITRDEMNRVFIYGKVIGSVPQTYRRHG
ncbi:XRE family transcriptional regulator [Rahnella aceris]|uniref:XRE family transcriptional regulator n=1 Tax=Rahnella sp. (strain Y9602) TaxID=2703885 RepID=UPI001F48E8DE|nr:helix-turn-helix transcriptional regulator [Rahnella aceris]